MCVAVGGSGRGLRRAMPDTPQLHVDARQLDVDAGPLGALVHPLAYFDLAQRDTAKVRNHHHVPERLHSGDRDFADALDQGTCDGLVPDRATRVASLNELLDAGKFLMVLFLQLFGKTVCLGDLLGLFFDHIEKLRVLQVGAVVGWPISKDSEVEGQSDRESADLQVLKLRPQECHLRHMTIHIGMISGDL